MKKIILAACAALTLGACSPNQTETVGNSAAEASDSPLSNSVVETIMSRRSVRAYDPVPVGRDTMDVIIRCGLNAPNAMNAQKWAVRVVDNQTLLDSMTAAFVADKPEMAEDPGFRNMFRNAPTVAFIAAPAGAYSGVDCGLLGENMILSAWSFGIGSCCLGGPVRFINSEEGAPFLSRLGFPEGYELIYAIGFGHPAESPEAKPRDLTKGSYVD
ncbi:MAG: nitroreductase family protein [Clostridium sp.]|nr:nitroreductase family protein [Clostridium sp.]